MMDRREVLKKTAMGMGIAITTPAITAILNSCSPSKPDLGWQPQVLNEDQAHAVRALADVLLPKTDTPGALDMMADRFVDIMISNTYSDKDKNKLLSELDNFLEEVKSSEGDSFDECGADTKQALVAKLEQDSSFDSEKVWGKTVSAKVELNFYRKLKGLIMFGFYTSEEVGKNIFVYDPVPGKHIGCIPLSEVGNSWTEG